MSIDVEVNGEVYLPVISPIKTIAHYVEDFNNADHKALNNSSGSPSFG
jgi:hypothetical protein